MDLKVKQCPGVELGASGYFSLKVLAFHASLITDVFELDIRPQGDSVF